MINTQEEKIKLLEQAGLDHLIIMEFTLDFSRTSSEDFVEQFLVDKLHARIIVVGFNHYFGHNREGSYDMLYEAGGHYSFQVEEIPEQEIQNETVSSTRIRKALLEGNIQRANAYLQHHYMVTGKLEAGCGPWEAAGYPCQRIHLTDPLKLLPPCGSYAASFEKNGLQEKALVQIGESHLKLYPLEPHSLPAAGERSIHFHLKLSSSGERDLSTLLETVSELIY
jgi:riboflavin kinase/FMN adenylyltransferase